MLLAVSTIKDVASPTPTPSVQQGRYFLLSGDATKIVTVRETVRLKRV